MFELFNIYHYIYLILIVFVFLYLDNYFSSLSKDKKNKYLFILSIFNFIIHFLKVFLYPYKEVSTQFYYLSLSNLCAVNVVLYPLILKINNKILNNYFMLFGFISGVIAILYPYELINFNAFNIESIRYFITHFILMFISFNLFKGMKLNYRYLFISYFIFFIEQGIILFNDFIYFKFDIIPNIDYSNGSLLYGINNKLESIKWIIDLFILDTFKTNEGYIYLLWQITPSLVLFLIIFIVVILFIDNRRFKNDWYKVKYYLIRKFNKKYFNKSGL